MIGHDDESVELEFALVTVAEEGGDEEFGDDVPLEDASSLVCDGGQRVGLVLRRILGWLVPGAEARGSRWPGMPGLKSGPILQQRRGMQGRVEVVACPGG